MKTLNLINLVREMLNYSRINLDKQYNDVRNILKENYDDIIVFNTIKYVKGEFTESQEQIFLQLHKGI
tara:strand:- start:1480 stop:1683 length:204 start_codon:yes stop_codon:yes gene_type:complete